MRCSQTHGSDNRFHCYANDFNDKSIPRFYVEFIDQFYQTLWLFWYERSWFWCFFVMFSKQCFRRTGFWMEKVNRKKRIEKKVRTFFSTLTKRLFFDNIAISTLERFTPWIAFVLMCDNFNFPIYKIWDPSKQLEINFCKQVLSNFDLWCLKLKSEVLFTVTYFRSLFPCLCSNFCVSGSFETFQSTFSPVDCRRVVFFNKHDCRNTNHIWSGLANIKHGYFKTLLSWIKYIPIKGFSFHVIDVDWQVGVKMSNFIKCQVKMKAYQAYPEELLKLALKWYA